MVLKILMCLILTYPLIRSIIMCKAVMEGKGTTWLAGKLVQHLPPTVAKVVSLLVPLAVILLYTLLILMKPIEN